MSGKANEKQETPAPSTDTSIDELAKAVGRIQVNEDSTDAPEELVELAAWIETGVCKKLLVVSGAGVSTAANLPDFRTPGTGLYDNLQQYNLPYPEAVFELDFYARDPKPFVTLAKEMWPGLKHTPTLTHSFLALLSKKDKLLRNYSQNIDGLEFLAQVPHDKLVECHGHFRSASCIECRAPADEDVVKKTIVQEGTVPLCDSCGSYVKPDIVFFGEGLPSRFHELLKSDIGMADCCLILGTSLQVAPVSMIPDMVSKECKRVLLNRELVGSLRPSSRKKRDIFVEGDCDDSILTLAKLLNWEDELLEMHEQAKISMKQTKKGNV